MKSSLQIIFSRLRSSSEPDGDQRGETMPKAALPGKAVLDLAILACLTVAGFVVAGEYDAFEAFVEWSQAHEEYEADEILILCALLTVSLTVFCLRRIRELKAQVRLRQKAEEKTQRMAYHDDLTGLPNRKHFKERLEQELSRCARDNTSLALLMIDLDKFKYVNDTYGHGAGDALLRGVAKVLQECVRKSDLVARLGGDEFCIIQPGMEQPGSAAALAKRILAKLSEPIPLRESDLVVGASVGVAVSSAEGAESEVLMQEADTAMYLAKSEGRATFRFFGPEMDSALRERFALEKDLRLAVSQRSLEVYYQPLFNASDKSLIGFEALLRWNHPERGMVSPAVFVPIAEECGLIHSIGSFVLKEACTRINELPGQLKIAVNVSPPQFTRGNLVESVKQVLSSTGLAANRLELEITESILLRDTHDTIATLHQLKALGVRIAMDDFGTGYSSLSYLRSFPFDKIKIDQSFIRSLDANANNSSIIRAIVALGKSLGMRTTAEGVESEDQLATIMSEGCEEVQGFLLGRPMPLAQIRELISGTGMPHVKDRLPDSRVAS